MLAVPMHCSCLRCLRVPAARHQIVAPGPPAAKKLAKKSLEDSFAEMPAIMQRWGWGCSATCMAG